MAWLRQRDIDDEKRTPDLIFRLRNMFISRSVSLNQAEKELKDLGIKNGGKVLDFGCGSGQYAIAAAKLVGDSGKVFAVDLHPSALRMVDEKASALGLSNVETIYSDLETGLDAGSVDMVLLFDALRGRKDIKSLLNEVHRVVKRKGAVHVKRSGLKNGRVEELMVKDGFFHLKGKHNDVLRFGKLEGEFYEI